MNGSNVSASIWSKYSRGATPVVILELYRCAVAAGLVARGTIAPEFAKTVFETADALMDERKRRDETL